MGQQPSLTLVAMDLHTPLAYERAFELVAWAARRARRGEMHYVQYSPSSAAMHLSTDSPALALKIYDDRSLIMHEAGLSHADVTFHEPRPLCAGGPTHVLHPVPVQHRYHCSLCGEDLGRASDDPTCPCQAKNMVDADLNVRCEECNVIWGRLTPKPG